VLLEHVVGRAELEHLDRLFVAQGARHDDERQIDVERAHVLQRVDAARARQAIVGEHDVELAALDVAALNEGMSSTRTISPRVRPRAARCSTSSASLESSSSIK
jgi:hypothetical protein